MMSKNQSSTDTVDKLTLRQAELQVQLFDAIKDGGMGHSEWIKLRTVSLPMAHRGYLSEHGQKVVDDFTEHNSYTIPYKLKQLVRLLSREFNGVIRSYTQAGRLQQDPEMGQIDVRTTLSEPVSIDKSLKKRRTLR